MSVKVDEVIGVSGFIKPGDHVDVMVTIDQDSKSQNPVAKMILGNLKVLAAGMQYEKSGSEKDPKPVQVMTLEVDIEEAEKLALASTQGKLRLALRNPLNNDKVLTKGANVAARLSSFRAKSAQDGQPEFHVKSSRALTVSKLNFKRKSHENHREIQVTIHELCGDMCVNNHGCEPVVRTASVGGATCPDRLGTSES